MIGQKNISGVVTDESGTTLIGANVIVEGTSIGTITDIDGSYSLEIPADATTLIYSYTGYTTVTKAIDGDVMNVVLAEGEILDEVVLIGYGEVKREDATGLVQTVDTELFNKGAIANPQELLAGKIAGVAITTDGRPGGGSEIRIRGESSLGASNDPLYIVDGIPLDNGKVDGTITAGARNPLNFLNPTDIESITVLKDASATAIYGSRASGGVIIINTKKGNSGHLKIGYNASVALGSATNRIEPLSPDEFRAAARSYLDSTHTALQYLNDDINTDWQDEIYQNSVGTDHSVTATGGLLGVPLRASAGFSSFDGLLRTDNFTRYSGGLNLSPSFLDNKLQIKLGIKASSVQNQFADKGAINGALTFDPTQPVRDDNQFGNYFAWLQPDGTPIGLAAANPVALIEQTDDKSTVNRYVANANIDYRFSFLPALRANLNLGLDKLNAEGSKIITPDAEFAYNPVTGSGVNNIYSESKTNTLLEFYLNYKKELLGRDFDAMVGYSWQKFDFDKITDDNNFERTDSVNIRTNSGELFMISLFGRVNYSPTDWMLLTGTLRQDQSSRFSPETRAGLFPSAAVALKLLETKGDILNQLKMRLSWGQTGQQDIGGYYLWQGLYENSDNQSKYQQGDEFITTSRPNGYDRNIKWETTTTYNLGLDFSILRNRLGGTIDFYQRDTRDLLVNNVPTVVGSNLTNIVATNLGDMQSRGVELSLNLTPVLTDNTVWDISLNTAYNKNEVLKLSNDSTSVGIEVGGISGGVGNNIQVHSVGFEPYAFFLQKQVYGDDGKIIPGSYEDLNGDGVVNNDDRYRIETTRPDVTFGLSSNLSYKNFDFSFAARANFGAQIFNNLQTSLGNLTSIGNNNVLNNVHPVAVEQNIELAESVLKSDHFLQDADFFRLDHITLGYRFDKLIGDYLRVYTTVQNALVLTNYEGLDPEVFSGIDNEVFPRSRNFVFGLSVQF